MPEPGGGATGLSVRPSVVTLPERRPDRVATLLDYFVVRFPHIAEAVWRERFAAGKVWCADGPVAAGDPYTPRARLFYRREVEREPPVRTDARTVWQDHDILVVDKPPHLPVTPGGRWVRSCLLHLLRERTGLDDLAPLHRLDRMTSGIVVLSCRRETRAHYARLFQTDARTVKVYSAVCEVRRGPPPRSAVLEHHITRSADEHWRQVVDPGFQPNAFSEIELLDTGADLALYRVLPATGRKHQIRVQLAVSGLPILGDPLYGSRPFHDPDDVATRLWLDAHRLRIDAFPRPGGSDPLTAEWRSSRDPADLLRRAARVDRG